MRAYIMAGLLAAAATPHAAMAQEMATQGYGTSFRGVRIEGDIGYDRFKAQGDHNGKLGYGGTAGFDGQIGDRIVIGAEGSWWHARHGNEACGAFNGGTDCSFSYQELGAAVRAGYLVTPRVLVFGKGGYVSSDERNTFNANSGLFYDSQGNIVGPGFRSTQRRSSDGYQAGGGVEFSLTDMFYINGQYVYSRYDNHTSRQHAFVGVGLRFK